MNTAGTEVIQGIQGRRDSRRAYRKDERTGRRWGSGRERKRLTKHMGRKRFRGC